MANIGQTYSGTYVSTDWTYYCYSVDWSYYLSQSGSTTTLTWSCRMYRNNSSSTYGSSGATAFTVRADSYEKSIQPIYYSLFDDPKGTTLATNTGSYSTTGSSISFYVGGFGSYSTTITFTPATPPGPTAGATVPSLPSSATMGNTITISLPRGDSSYTHALTYSFGSLSNQTSGISNYSSATTSTSFTIPASLSSQIPSSSSGTLTVTCKTYYGSTLIGTNTASMTVYVPSGSVSVSLSISEGVSSPNIAGQFGVFVQGKSRLKVTLSASAPNGASISSRSFVFEGITYTYTGSAVTTNPVVGSGNLSISASATDSRGATGYYTGTVSVVPYQTPTITRFDAHRTTSSGGFDDSGSYAAVSIMASVWNIASRNTASYSLESREANGYSWTQISGLSNPGLIFDNTQNPLVAGTFDPTKIYVLRLTVSDFFGSVSWQINLLSENHTFVLKPGGKGAAFGMDSEKSYTLQVAWDLEVLQDIICRMLTGVFRVSSESGSNWLEFGSSGTVTIHASKIVLDASTVVSANGISNS